jgi:dihydroflavonol-4-reductase
MSKKILITGANGFLGSAITRKALEKKFKVKVLVRETSDISNLKNLDVEIFRGDLSRKDTIIDAFKNCHTFFHVAADYRLWARKVSEIYESNVLGTQNVIELIKDIPNHKLVYTSSVATLGTQALGESNENTPVKFEQMVGDYKKSKYLAENIVMDYIKNKNLKCIIVNPSTPIGPRDIKPTPTGKIVLQMLKKKMPAYVETGLNFVHVDDVAEGHFQALENGKNGEKYILGGENMSLKKFLDLIAQQANVPKINIKIPSKPLYPFAFLNEILAFFMKNYEPMLTINGLRMSEKKMYFSSEKAKKELGYRPRNVKNAIKDCVVWMNEQFNIN